MSCEAKRCKFVRNKSIIKTSNHCFHLKYESSIHNIAFSSDKVWKFVWIRKKICTSCTRCACLFHPFCTVCRRKRHGRICFNGRKLFSVGRHLNCHVAAQTTCCWTVRAWIIFQSFLALTSSSISVWTSQPPSGLFKRPVASAAYYHLPALLPNNLFKSSHGHQQKTLYDFCFSNLLPQIGIKIQVPCETFVLQLVAPFDLNTRLC